MRAPRALWLVLLWSCKASESTTPVGEVSKPISTAAAPLIAAPPRPPVRFAVIGDFGSDTPDEAAVAALVKSWKPEFVITAGDNNYPRGEAATIDTNIGKYYAEFIGNYKGAFGPGSATNRFFPSLGNHDWYTVPLPYLDYFTLPGNGRYYDVDRGLVHLYAIDSDLHEPDGTTPTSTQGKWLEERLAASKACFDIVYFHHAPYSTSEHGSTEGMRWPMARWGAEAVITGHDHVYERSSVDGIPYFVNGLGGAPKYDFPRPKAPETQVRFNDAYGAMLVKATPADITYEFFSTDGTRRDAITVPANCK